MNKYKYFTLLPVFVLVLLTNFAVAATPNLTGTYKVTGAKYIVPSLAACQGVNITLKITRPCTGRLLKGSITIGATTVPVQGRIFSDDKTLFLSGSSATANAILGGEYVATTKTIKVTNDNFSFFSASFPQTNTVFDDFSMAKQP